MITKHHSITEIYSQLCDQFREFRRKEKDVPCAVCKVPKSEHLFAGGIGHCQIASFQREYRRSDADLIAKNERCLEHLEEFMKLMGWM